MPSTYTPIATTTLSTAANAFSFTSIPNTYTDLKLVIVAMATTGTIDTWLYMNNDTATNYSGTRLSGSGSAASSARFSNVSDNYDTNLSSISTLPCLITHDIFSYAGSTNKTYLTSVFMDKISSGVVNQYVKLWRSTAAINRLDYRAGGTTTFAIGTTATLYGVKSA